MRTALDARFAEHGAGVRLPHAARRGGMSMRLVSRHANALVHPSELAHMHNNIHLYFIRLATNCSTHIFIIAECHLARCKREQCKNATRLAPPCSDCKMLATALHMLHCLLHSMPTTFLCNLHRFVIARFLTHWRKGREQPARRHSKRKADAQPRDEGSNTGGGGASRCAATTATGGGHLRASR